MSEIWVTSDSHFGHAKCLQFDVPCRACLGAAVSWCADCHGTRLVKMRPFATVQEMDEYIIDQWNAVVKPQDKVYHLGDVAMNRKHLPTIARCHGHRRLVRGNHDIFDTSEYMEYFDDIYGTRHFPKVGVVLSHIPLHPESVKPGYINIHGHLHNNQPQGHLGPLYYNVCVEMTEYRPLTLGEVKERHAKLFAPVV